MNKFFTALKKNTDDIRKKTLLVAGTVAATLAAGILLSKFQDNTREIIILEEPNEEDIQTEYLHK